MAEQKCPGTMLEIAGLAAQLILENGAETYRVEDTVLRLCNSFGFPGADVLALSTGVLISIAVPGDSLSTIRRVRKRGMNLARVNRVNEISRSAAAGALSMGETLEQLRGVEQCVGMDNLRLSLMAGLSAGGFALMFGGGWKELLVAALCGLAAQWAAVGVRRADLSLVLVSLVGGLTCSLVTMGAYFALGLTPAGVETTLAGAIMPLISGLMMTNAVRDFLRGDLLSGIARGVEALLVATMVALGISIVLRFYLPADPSISQLPPPWFLGTLYAGLATLFFCPLLNIPRRAILPASLLGALAYGLYTGLSYLDGLGATGALFLAAVAVAFFCDRMARHMRMIATVFLCAALIPLVPGLGLYRTMQELLLGNPAPALTIGLQTLISVGAIALGAALGSLHLGFPRKKEPLK